MRPTNLLTYLLDYSLRSSSNCGKVPELSTTYAILKGPAHAAVPRRVYSKTMLLERGAQLLEAASTWSISLGAASLLDGRAQLQQFAHRQTNSGYFRNSVICHENTRIKVSRYRIPRLLISRFSYYSISSIKVMSCRQGPSLPESQQLEVVRPPATMCKSEPLSNYIRISAPFVRWVDHIYIRSISHAPGCISTTSDRTASVSAAAISARLLAVDGRRVYESATQLGYRQTRSLRCNPVE